MSLPPGPPFQRPSSIDTSGWHNDDVDAEAVDDSLPTTPVVEKRKPDVHRSLIEPTLEDSYVEADSTPTHARKAELAASGATPEPKKEEDERQCRICFGGVEEEDMLGRLISPCLCTGSMRYVHVQCINAWRGTGTNTKAFMECPQCHHHYRLRRTLISGIATSRPLLFLLSSTFFLLLTLATGALIHSFLLWPRLSTSILSPETRITTSSLFDLDLGDEYLYDGGGIVIVGGGSTLVSDVVFGAIQAFTLIASRLAEIEVGVHLPPALESVLYWSGLRFLLGISVLGSLSFISLLFSFSLFAPLQIANNFRGGFFRRFRAQRTEGGGMTVGTVMIVVFVLVGAINSMVSVYNGVRVVTSWALKWVEASVLEVNPEERRKEKERRERERHESWGERWRRERRWRRWEGWREVGLRTRLGIWALGRRWLEAFKAMIWH